MSDKYFVSATPLSKKRLDALYAEHGVERIGDYVGRMRALEAGMREQGITTFKACMSPQERVFVAESILVKFWQTRPSLRICQKSHAA